MLRKIFSFYFFLIMIASLANAEEMKADIDELSTFRATYPDNPHVLEELRKYILYKPNEANLIGYIAIEDHNTAISESTWLYVKQALAYYKTTKPIFIILKLNTPGGDVFSSQKISDALKELDTQYGIPVIAYIDDWAISAGAMLAYSCRFIAPIKGSAMGAAAPVLDTGNGEMKEASEKIVSALRTDFANRARFFDRNPYIAEAMVDKDVILVMRQGKITKLTTESEVQMTGLNPDIVISSKGKLLTLDAQEMLKYGVADFLLFPGKRFLLTEQEEISGKWPAEKTLLFQHAFFQNIPHGIVDVYQMDWKTQFFVFLATPAVSSLLLLGLMLGIYMEMSAVGFGVAGTIASFCLFLIILSHLSLEIANWLEVILFFTGILIIAVDLFVLPTFGLFGLLGALLAIGGLFAMMLPDIGAVKFDVDTQTLNAAGEAVIQRLGWLSGTIVLGFISMLLLGRYFAPSLNVFDRLVLRGQEQEAAKGYVAGIDSAKLPPIGVKAVAFTPLRLSGKISIGNTIYDAMSSGYFIEKGQMVTVVRIEGSVIVVEEG